MLEKVTPAMQTQYSPVVQELSRLLANNPDLMKAFEIAFAAQKPGSYWSGKNINDMYLFFDEWRTFSPLFETARTYIDNFGSFYQIANHGGWIEEGLVVVRDPRFAEWMKRFVIAHGAFLDCTESAGSVAEWAEKKEINLGIYDIPKNGFGSFNEFFSRKLKPGVRPIAEPRNNAVLTSPADCTFWEISEQLAAETTFEVKGREYNVGKLLDDVTLAKRFEGGRAVICFLMPENYHRFHAPIGGEIIAAKQLGGLYFGARGFVSNFFEHRRGFYIINTEDVGQVGFVAVGIATISSVNMPRVVGEHIMKGDEIGHFAYGGSAVVLLFQPGRLESTICSEPSGPYKIENYAVSVGQRIGNLRQTSVQ